jgi:hypothetical protein
MTIDRKNNYALCYIVHEAIADNKKFNFTLSGFFVELEAKQHDEQIIPARGVNNLTMQLVISSM